MLFNVFAALVAVASVVSAHTVLTYPGWRGNTLDGDKQWLYPCGGIGPTTNRTIWPIGGGAIAFQPGHATGHSTAMISINMFIGTNDTLATAEWGNIHNITVVPLFQLVAPDNTDKPYNGTFCYPKVSFTIPSGTVVEPGTNATIQIIELAKNGASLYNCADITFEDPAVVPPVPDDVCFNTTGIGLQDIFSTEALVASSAPATKSMFFSFITLFVVAFALISGI